MKGVQFLIDDEGERTAVMIDLSIHSELWEDFFDAVIAKERQDEPREPPGGSPAQGTRKLTLGVRNCVRQVCTPRSGKPASASGSADSVTH